MKEHHSLTVRLITLTTKDKIIQKRQLSLQPLYSLVELVLRSNIHHCPPNIFEREDKIKPNQICF